MTRSQRPEGKNRRPVSVVVPLILIAAVFAIASSALLVRRADAPAMALAFWRTLGGSLLLWPAAARNGSRSAGAAGGPTSAPWGPIVAAGIALAVHFASWLASLEMTSVAASVTLVSTAPLMIAGGQAVTGRRPRPATVAALALATTGTAVVAVGDLSAADADGLLSSRALAGDALALVGAAAMAVYLVAGARARSRLGIAAYGARTYGVAATTLAACALAASVVGRSVPLVGFGAATWLAIVGMILGPQMIGHTGLNYLLGRLSPLTVGLALLTEPLAATALTWLVLGEVPPAATAMGAPLILVALVVQLIVGHRPAE